MQRYRYKAASISGDITSGVLTAASAAEARHQLRGAEMRVIALKPVSIRPNSRSGATILECWKRSRRRSQKAAFFDGLATLVRSGLPIRSSLTTLRDGRRIQRPIQHLTSRLAQDIRAGQSIEEAFLQHASWFDELECAVITASVRTGDLPTALSRLALRCQRSAELRGKIIAALSYPALVLGVAMVVVTILGTRTLPPIVTVLREADIAVPKLTLSVMSIGEAIAGGWPILWFSCGVFMFVFLMVWLRTRQINTPASVVKNLPRVIVLPQLAALARSIADLTSTGVPLGESLCVAAPSIRGLGADHLRATLARIHDRLEQGEELADAFDDGVWFDPEFHRLLAVGQDAGELPDMLSRLADRNEEEARRSVDRLAALLEPAAILTMSVLVGTVVLAAVLPLIRMQELI